jgi:hypothetical protein
MTIGDLAIADVNPTSDEARDLVAALDEELRRRYPGAVIEGLLPAT